MSFFYFSVYLLEILHIVSNWFRKIFSLDLTSFQRCFDIFLKPFDIADHLRGCLFVQRIIGVRLDEQKENSSDDIVEIQNWFPICSEDIQTHVSLQINVWMIDFRAAVDFRRLMRVVCSYFNSEEILRSSPKSTVVRPDCQLHVCQHSLIWPDEFCVVREILI